jgi:hypothetical protein
VTLHFIFTEVRLELLLGQHWEERWPPMRSGSKGTEKQRQRQLFSAVVAPVILVLSITNSGEP